MCLKVLLFAGTYEGRQIAEHLAGKPLQLDISVATSYAGPLLPQANNIRVFSSRLDEEQIAGLLRENHYDLVVDATHPFAREVSANVKKACAREKLRLLRVIREEDAPGSKDLLYASDTGQALQLLSLSRGPIFLTTGSKTLKEFMQLPQAGERLFVRILPVPSMLEQALSCGLSGSHITCAQGPFDAAANLAAIGSIRARWSQEQPHLAREPLTLVTKESGRAGGFQEKVEAAREAGVACIVLRRPKEESSEAGGDTTVQFMSLAQTLSYMDSLLSEESLPADPLRAIFLIGCGMSVRQLTLEADAAIRSCDLLIGAQRMLDMTSHYGKDRFCSYDPAQILDFLLANPQYRRTAILFSGDIGFYSGAARMREWLASCPDFRITPLSGISSPVHFLNTIGKSYEDVHVLSLHGKTAPVMTHLRTHEKLLLLLGKKEDIPTLCRTLLTQGLKNIDMTIGSCLQTPQECIIKGKPMDFIDREFDPLSIVYLENPAAAQEPVLHGLPDAAFRRGNTPMTKEEVRSIVLSKLQLTGQAVFYDIGAGTGSIAVDAARMIPDGTVYAIEKCSDALSLILYNASALHADNLYAVPGTAPEILDALPAPTHAFIGGSSGRIREILQTLLQKNPQVRVTATAITLETLSMLLKVREELSLPEPEIVQIQVTRTKKAGPSHMMQAQNPVFIVTFPALHQPK